MNKQYVRIHSFKCNCDKCKNWDRGHNAGELSEKNRILDLIENMEFTVTEEHNITINKQELKTQIEEDSKR